MIRKLDSNRGNSQSHYSSPVNASFLRCRTDSTDILRESQNLLFSPTSPDKELIYRPDTLAPAQVLQSSRWKTNDHRLSVFCKALLVYFDFYNPVLWNPLIVLFEKHSLICGTLTVEICLDTSCSIAVCPIRSLKYVWPLLCSLSRLDEKNVALCRGYTRHWSKRRDKESV